ncbi:unnamed protein product [Meloidogyne enterolobii]|uniref:Uncharacterized protein n=1 Tax=Meloidogyne enterolobii TaxID=390850 RepID=A0ACB1AS26_MELEN
MYMLAKFIFIFLLFFCTCSISKSTFADIYNGVSNDGDDDIIESALNAISVASTGAADELLALGNLNQNTADFMKMIIPVGGIVAKEINPKEGSPAYKQLEKFKTRTEEIWSRRSRDSKIGNYQIHDSIGLYYDEVTEPIMILKKLTDQILNPNLYKSEQDIKYFKIKCEISPIKILNFLRTFLVRYCPDPVKPSEAESFSLKREWLVQALTRLSVYNKGNSPDVGDYIMEFSSIYDSIGKLRLLNIENLATFSNQYATYKEGFKALFKELQSFIITKHYVSKIFR